MTTIATVTQDRAFTIDWHRLSRHGVRAVGVLSVLVAAEFAVRSGLVPNAYVPAPSSVLVKLGHLVTESSFWLAVFHTLKGWALGLGLTACLAIPIGLALGTSRLLHTAFRIPIEFLRPIPPIALLPVAVLMLGNTVSMKVFLVLTGAFWPLLFQTIYGVQDTDPVLRDTARSYGLGRVAQLLRITLPSALPFIATGLRVSSTIALILAIGAEYIVGVPGLGSEMVVAYSAGAAVLTYALVMASGVLGILTSYSLRGLERIVLHWHTSVRTGGAL